LRWATTTTASMATARRATKTTMMAKAQWAMTITMMTMATTTATATAMATVRWAAAQWDTTNDDGNGRDDNDVMTTMATVHQTGYYAHFIHNWNKCSTLWRQATTNNDRQRPTKMTTTRMATA
jgi:hypothetical protein